MVEPALVKLLFLLAPLYSLRRTSPLPSP